MTQERHFRELSPDAKDHLWKAPDKPYPVVHIEVYQGRVVAVAGLLPHQRYEIIYRNLKEDYTI